MTEKAIAAWVDASGKEIDAGAEVAIVAKVVGRHGGGRVSLEPVPGQRIILSGKLCDQGKAGGRRALQEANALIGAREKELEVCRKELDATRAGLAGVQAEFDAYIKSQGKPKGG